MLIYVPTTGTTTRLHLVLSSLLGKLNGFRTLEEHAASAVDQGWFGGDERLAKEGLEELEKQGLLFTLEAVLDRLRHSGETPDVRPHITVMAWSTRDRPALLGRSVESFVANARRYGRNPDCIMFDDSRRGESRTGAMAALGAAEKKYGIRAYYASRDTLSGFAAALIELTRAEGVPPDVVDFSLFDPEGCGLTYGAARNAVQLAAAGSMYMSSDDDMLCAAALPYEGDGGLELASMVDLNEIYFFEDRQSLLNSIKTSEEDVIGRHESLLGRSVAACLEGVAGQVYLERADQEFLEIITSGPACVAATAAGTFGDSGMGSPRTVFTLREEARERLVESETRYRSAFVSREILQVLRRPTITSGPFFPGMNIGLDNRTVLPPFFPVLRGEDFIFAHTLRSCVPRGLIGFPAVAVAHDPGDVRSFLPGEAFNIALNMSEILFLAIQSRQRIQGSSSENRQMQAAGAYLEELGELDPVDFENHLRNIWLASISFKIGYLEQSLAFYHEHPRFWADDIKKYIHSLEHFALHGQVTVPRDLLPGRTPEEARALGQKLIGRFGELLRWWPVIWNAARRMNEEGRGLARPLGEIV
ncbi:MAG TPA: hypothetical protein ENN35_06195 [Deltaproteobacteria bacterium]|nr:hypothetical protein [Deltaproteobacteria bacterium]